MRTFCYAAQTVLVVGLILLTCRVSSGFIVHSPSASNRFGLGGRNRGGGSCQESKQKDEQTSSYETSDASSKGIVSSLTSLVNFVMTPTSKNDNAVLVGTPPSSPVELMNRIRDDYIVNNYLWTGNIDLASFEPDCRFTDPTLSFVGRDTFVKNVDNLRVIVDNLVIEPGDCASNLLNITINEEEQYIQSRWNMVGKLNALPWKPRIDVIGRTKFWFRQEENGYQVYFYDECWEVPAFQALLQLVTPAGTIPNTSSKGVMDSE